MERKELVGAKKTSYVICGDSETSKIRCQDTTSEDWEPLCVCVCVCNVEL
jgi:hypothetical protein